VSTRTMIDRYRTGVGHLAHLLHRVSGLALSGYLLIHIWDIGAITRGGATSFDEAMAVFDTPFWKLMDALLVAAVLFHAFNGIRILLFDAGVGLKYQRAMFWVSLLLTLAIFMLVFVKAISNLAG
jgi:succinate dehydrogenase / fumarate reductase, cytochrome b subunit